MIIPTMLVTVMLTVMNTNNTTTVAVATFFPGLGCQTVLEFAAARDAGCGGDDSWNCNVTTVQVTTTNVSLLQTGCPSCHSSMKA